MVNGNRIRERDLVLPVVQLIAEFGERDFGLPISEITRQLRKRLPLSDADQAILKGRKDDHFSQVVRNLVSHRTLEKEGLAEYRKGGPFGKGAYVLTLKGRAVAGGAERTQLDLFRK
jgi:hypothetical protein